MGAILKILVADDQILFRDLFITILERIFKNSKITAVGNWPEAIKNSDSGCHDLLLLDLFMPDNSSNNWYSRVKHIINTQKGHVCMVSSSTNQAYIKQTIQAGAKGFICKTSTLEQMEYALQQVCEGKVYIPEQLWNSSQIPYSDLHIKITPRQKEILELVASGDSNKLICEKFGLSEGTVKRHLYNIYRSLGARNRSDAIRIANQQGLLFV